MSDECLITLETVVSFYIVYQAVMRKFTLAGKAELIAINKPQSIISPYTNNTIAITNEGQLNDINF